MKQIDELPLDLGSLKIEVVTSYCEQLQKLNSELSGANIKCLFRAIGCGDLEFEYKGVAVFAGIQKYTHNGYAKGGINSIVTKSAEVGATYAIPKSMLPQGWEEVYMDLISTLRHEIEHLTQFGTNVKQAIAVNITANQ